MLSATRIMTGAATLLGLLLVATTAPAAPLNVIIGNDPANPDGSYLNAGNLAETMTFTRVLVVADNSITVAEPVDLSTSLVFGLTLRAPTVTIGGTVKMGAGGFFMDAVTVNLEAELHASDGSRLDASRLVAASQPAGPGVINVDGTGSVEQATTLGLGWSAPATLNLLGGAHPLENLAAVGALAVNMAGGSVGSASIGGGSAMDWSGGQILQGVLVFTGGALEIFGNGFQVAPAADCALLPESAWVSAPAQLVGAGHCVRGQLADGSSFRTDQQRWHHAFQRGQRRPRAGRRLAARFRRGHPRRIAPAPLRALRFQGIVQGHGWFAPAGTTSRASRLSTGRARRDSCSPVDRAAT